MTGSAANINVWEGADVFVASVGTTLPTDTTTDLDDAFVALGLLTDDGMTKTQGKDTSTIPAWGIGAVRTTKKNFSHTFQVAAMEDNDTVFGIVHPGSTSSVTGGVTTRTIKREIRDERAWVFQVTDGDTTKRLVVPRGEVTAVADVKIDDSDAEVKQITVNALASSDGTFYLEITDLAGAAPAA